MAKRHLEQYDSEGHLLEIYLNDDEVMVGDKTLEEKLGKMDEEIGNAGDGTVKSVTLNGTKAEPDENGDVELELEVPEQVQADWEEDDSSDPAYIKHKPTVDDVLDEDSENAIANKTVTAAIAGLRQAIETVLGEGSATAIENFQEVLDFLAGVTDEETLIGLLNTMNTAIGGKVAKSDVYNGLDRTTEGKVLDARQGKALNDLITALNAAVNGKLSGSDVSITSTGDGTVVITVGTDTYTINLNHTHPNMAKLIVCEESDLPSTLDNSTIYAITDSGETEIEKLIIRGMEFAGGGVPDTGEPVVKSPANGSTINLGYNDGSGVSKTIVVRGVNLLGNLTVSVSTGLTLSYGQSTGQSSVTIPMAQALLGAVVTVAYGGTGGIDGTLTVTHDNNILSTVAVKAAWGYNTNGLVFHLDGADATTSQWVDRKGDIAFAMNNVTLDGNGGVVFNGTDSYGRYAAANSLGFKPSTHTIEVVANIGGTDTALLFMQSSEGELAFGITGINNVIVCAQTGQSDKTEQRRVKNVARGLMSFSFANMAAYRNKSSQSVSADGCFDPTANAGVFVGARDTTRSFFQGTIYQIRVYNRLLTAEEILANQQIDINRYNIS